TERRIADHSVWSRLLQCSLALRTRRWDRACTDAERLGPKCLGQGPRFVTARRCGIRQGLCLVSSYVLPPSPPESCRLEIAPGSDLFCISVLACGRRLPQADAALVDGRHVRISRV